MIEQALYHIAKWLVIITGFEGVCLGCFSLIEWLATSGPGRNSKGMTNALAGRLQYDIPQR